MNESGDSPGMMCFIGPLLNIVIAKRPLEQLANSDGQSHRQLLETELAALADGFTFFEVAGVWRGSPEPSLLYLVSLPREGAGRLVQFLCSLRARIGEDAIFLAVTGLGL